MSLQFDARCTCAGCGIPVPDFERLMKNGGQRIESTKIPGGRELIVQVAVPCVACQSYRVKLVTTAQVGGR